MPTTLLGRLKYILIQTLQELFITLLLPILFSKLILSPDFYLKIIKTHQQDINHYLNHYLPDNAFCHFIISLFTSPLAMTIAILYSIESLSAGAIGLLWTPLLFYQAFYPTTTLLKNEAIHLTPHLPYLPLNPINIFYHQFRMYAECKQYYYVKVGFLSQAFINTASSATAIIVSPLLFTKSLIISIHHCLTTSLIHVLLTPHHTDTLISHTPLKKTVVSINPGRQPNPGYN